MIRLSCWSFVVLFCLVDPASVEAGVSKTAVKQVVKDFNTQYRSVRDEHAMLPVNYLEYDGKQYGYHVPTRMKRLAETGDEFRIHDIKTKNRHVILELETRFGAELDVLVYDNEKLTQMFVDEVVPLVIHTLFEFGEAPAQPPFVGNRESGLYHLGSCNHLPAVAERQELESAAPAAAAGYRPCPVCFPKDHVLPLENYSNVRLEAIEQARLFEVAFPVVEDPSIQERLRVVGEKVLAGFPLDLIGFDYEIKVVHSTLPQAVAFPTGFIFVTDSLVDMVEHADELEFVIAHEIAHCELNLPPIGDEKPYIVDSLLLTWEYAATWMRHRETVADLVAIQYLKNTAEDPDFVNRATNIIAKLQFAHEALPTLESGKYDSHPTYSARLLLFRAGNFESAAAQPPIEFTPKRGGSVFEIMVLGKSKDEKSTYIYLLVEGTDLVNDDWNIGTTSSFANLVDAQGVSYELISDELYHQIGAGDVEIVKARAASAKRFADVDLHTGPLSMDSRIVSDDW